MCISININHNIMDQIIIALYLNVSHEPRSKAIEEVNMYKELFQNSNGITYHIITTMSGPTKMELIYPSNACVDLNEALLKMKEIETKIN